MVLHSTHAASYSSGHLTEMHISVRAAPSNPGCGAHGQVQDVAGIVERLLGFLETGKAFVTAETLVQLKDLLRRYPAIADACLASVSSIAPEVHAPTSRAAYCPSPYQGSICG